MDAYGRSGTDGVARGLALRNARIAAEATYSRGAKFEEDMSPAVGGAAPGRGGRGPLYRGVPGCGAFVRTARDLGWNVPIANVSFVWLADAMLALLIQHGKTSGREYTAGLVNSQVVPSYDDLTLPGVVEYRALMERHKPTVPETLRDAKYAPQKFSFISLEGYVNAKVIVEALRRAGPAPTRAALRQSLEGMRNVDLGIAAPLSFGPERHQGWTASTSPESRTAAGFRSRTGTRAVKAAARRTGDGSDDGVGADQEGAGPRGRRRPGHE